METDCCKEAVTFRNNLHRVLRAKRNRSLSNVVKKGPVVAETVAKRGVAVWHTGGSAMYNRWQKVGALSVVLRLVSHHIM